MSHIVIIGNGIAGITAARHIRKRSDHRITVISGESDHFFSRTALMYIYMGHMKYDHTKPYEDWFWEENRINLKRAWVHRVDFDQKNLILENQETQSYDILLLALGSQPNKFGWPGQDLNGVQGLYSLQDLELMEKNTQNVSKAVIVGGGLIGIEMAEMLKSRNIKVTYLVRENHFWDIVLPKEQAELIDEHIREHEIDLRLGTELLEIKGSEGRVTSVITNANEEIECQFVGLTVGVSPNIEWIKNSDLETDRGILVDEYLQTNLKNVYALGDCAQLRNPHPDRKAVEAVWYTGRIMGETVAKTVTGSQTTYDPGMWFNSAKFLDMEYQTYGTVTPKPKDGESKFFWQDLSGKKSLYFTFWSKGEALVGVSALGIRLRQLVVERWIQEKRTIEYVLEHLKDANFDPELFREHESEITETFNQQFDRSVKTGKKSWQRILSAMS